MPTKPTTQYIPHTLTMDLVVLVRVMCHTFIFV
nr:MAG TPA: hypothetical protein [Caudoviricetes sp.]